MGTPLYVTKTSLPTMQEFNKYIEQIFTSKQTTNHGPLVQLLEKHLQTYLQQCFLEKKKVCLCNNGTTALMLALRLTGLSGKKVITTPFTYVATVSSLLWEGCQPVFADIDPDTLCISPQAIRDCLKKHPDVAGIMPVHVYGNICDIESIQDICDEYDLRCIYDGAQAFGVQCNNKKLYEFGDCTILSFHATKVFHSVEGGCIVCRDEAMLEKACHMRAFGHVGDTHFMLGINAKLSELHAAMGLALLPHVDDFIAHRKHAYNLYTSLLPEKHFRRPTIRADIAYNYAYFPVIFPSEAVLLRVKNELEQNDIFPRRYFYPSLTTLPYLPESAQGSVCPVSDDIAKRVLCLPLSAEITDEDVEQTARCLNRVGRDRS